MVKKKHPELYALGCFKHFDKEYDKLVGLNNSEKHQSDKLETEEDK